MSFIDKFLGIDLSTLTPEEQLKRRLRALNIRATHTGTLPFWKSAESKVGELTKLLQEHGLEILQHSDKHCICKQLHGREYTFTWNIKTKRWDYHTSVDPVSGLNQTKRKLQKKHLYLTY